MGKVKAPRAGANDYRIAELLRLIRTRKRIQRDLYTSILADQATLAGLVGVYGRVFWNNPGVPATIRNQGTHLNRRIRAKKVDWRNMQLAIAAMQTELTGLLIM